MDILSLINNINTDWKNILIHIYNENNGNNIDKFLENEYVQFNVFLEILPPKNLIFNAFTHFNINETKIVIIGQDCYPTKGDAMGLCFSVPNNRKCAASLRNIFKELNNEYGKFRKNTDLTDWAKQGVLLLNCALTVREGTAGSHLKIWQPFTTNVIKYLAKNKTNIVYILWGIYAQQYSKYIDDQNNLVLKHLHPSPLACRSGKFLGNNHFKLANEYLLKNNKELIKWI